MLKPSLPKTFRVSPLFLLLVFILLIILAEAGYFFYTKARQRPSLPQISEEVALENQRLQEEANQKAESGKKQFEEIKKEIKDQKKEVKGPTPAANCLYAPLVDPQIGIYSQAKVQDSVFDYFYQGVVSKVAEESYQRCPYIYLTLKIREEYTLAIPKNLIAKTDLGEVSALIYKDHIGQRVKLRIRYEKDKVEPDILKILEWKPLEFLAE